MKEESDSEPNAKQEAKFPEKINIRFRPLSTFKHSKRVNSHDRVITEDSIVYFKKKLKKINYGYKLYSYICLAIYFLDLIVCIIDKKFQNLFSIIILLLMISLIIYHLFLFKHNFEIISRKIYKEAQKLIYIQYIPIALFYFDLLLVIFQILFIKIDFQETKMTFLRGSFTSIISFISYFICILFNIFFPGFLFVKLIQLKRCVKDLSIAQGEIYDDIQSWEVGVRLDQDNV